MAIMELLRIDSEMDTLIARRAHLDELEKMARNKGFITLAENGIARVLAGHTSLAELMRVVDLAKQSRVTA
jgi:general secretion pathway protein E/type IV pilus assembly protein PilB